MVYSRVRPATVSKDQACERVGIMEGLNLRTVTDPTSIVVRENSILVEVCEFSGRVDEARRKTVGVCLVVHQLGAHEIVQL